ncbi:MAG: sodium/glutamate symporter [Fermentimonas sp.]|jgi:ESS family glutamate:Na+ symporter
MKLSFDIYSTFLIMIAVLLTGRFLTKKIKFLKRYDIPEPVSGGLVFAILILVLTTVFDFKISFNKSLQEPLMLGFFTTLGLNADFKMLKKAGSLLIIFLLSSIGLLIVQNITGIGLTLAMGENPLIGLIGGSVSLTGGFGTGAAWGTVFEKAPYNFTSATSVAMACATFGVITGGLVGGPMANFLMKRYKIKGNSGKASGEEISNDYTNPLAEIFTKSITAESFINSLALTAISIFLGITVSSYMQRFSFTLPTFVWCLFFGIILRNFLSLTNLFKVFDREMDLIGDVCLSLFLAFVLMNINFLDLVHLAVPVSVVLIGQLVVMFLYGWIVTFRVCGRNYDAAVLVAGQCGFAIGSTYNAMANMQSITRHHGPSQQAFIIVSVVGAFFIDIINAFAINLFVMLPIFTP